MKTPLTCLLRRLATLALFTVPLVPAHAQTTIVSWDFAGEPGDQATTVSGSIHGSIQPSVLSRGPGLSAAADLDSFNATGWTTTSNLDTANANGDYITFTITPNPGVSFSLTELELRAIAPSSSSPDSFALRSSLDGFASNLRTFTLLVPSQTVTTLFLSSVPSLQDISTPVTFRIIGASATTAGAGFRLEGLGDDLVIQGTVVPEPKSLSFLLTSLSLLACHRIRRTAR